MIVRPWAQFATDIPDDSIEKNGDFVQWPGKAVTAAIAEMMRRRGYEVDEPGNLEHAGWDLCVTSGTRNFYLRVNMVDTFTLVFDQNYIFFKPRISSEYVQALKDLNEELRKDGRFHGLGWFTDFVSDPAVAGAINPVEGELPPTKTFGLLTKWRAWKDSGR